MKKFLLSFLALFFFLTPLAVDAKLDLGQARVEKAASTAGYDKADETSFAELIGTIIKGVLSFVGVIFMVLTVYAGFLWMTAQGEESKIEKAQGIIKSSVVGLVVMLGAYSITSFVVPMILDKTAGGNNSGGGSAGGEETILCCTVCPAQINANNNTCESSTVSTEAECMEKLGCDDNANDNVSKDCSVTPSPASQCGGTIKFVNCCTVTNKKGETRTTQTDETTCDNICNSQNGNVNVGGWECDFEEEVLESQCPQQ